ncbi:MAG: hypothetical protein H7Z42_16305, partial [Roseiflexaceae bacterium]|nr:hypothetical protein [Roseiflexaceae bacterium]
MPVRSHRILLLALLVACCTSAFSPPPAAHAQAVPQRTFLPMVARAEDFGA